MGKTSSACVGLDVFLNLDEVFLAYNEVFFIGMLGCLESASLSLGGVSIPSPFKR